MNPQVHPLFGQPKGLALGGTGLADGAQENAGRLVAPAWADGVRYFDTAPMYGAGASERLLGRALAGFPRDAFVLGSKVGRLVRGGEPVGPGENPRWRWDFSADGVRRSVEESLQRLGTDHLDYALIHDPDDFLAEATSQTYPALERLRDEGLIRAVGAGLTRVPTLQHLLERVRLDLALLAGRLSLVDGEAERDLLAVLADQSVALVVAAALQAGLVDGTDSGELHYAPTPPDVVARVAAIHEVCERHEIPIGAAALQFVLAVPEVSMVVTGAADVGQWRQNFGWSRFPVPSELWVELAERDLLPFALPAALR